jgi:hypothetical protein
MATLFQPSPGETVLYRSSPYRKWYDLVWRIGLTFVEVALFMIFSFTALTNLANYLFSSFLPADPAEVLSRIICQGILPLLVAGWFVEDTARIFTSELVLTDQRVWTKGFPYAWNPGREMRLSDIKSMSSRRDALFIHLKSTRRTQVHVLPDGKEIVKAFTQFTGKSDSG